MKQDNQKYCSECGELINVKAEICPKCGVRQFGSSVGICGVSTMYLGFRKEY